jgi:hypothetical protein
MSLQTSSIPLKRLRSWAINGLIWRNRKPFMITGRAIGELLAELVESTDRNADAAARAC